MRMRALPRLLLALGVLLAIAPGPRAQEIARTATVVTLDGPVTPASAGYLVRGIEEANALAHEFVLIEIDTPGGLVDSMKTIVKAMLASEVPVVTYVYPDGARSASAGLYITYAADVAAMAPNTNTGSATPIEMGGGPEAPPPAPTDEGEGEDAAPDLSNDASLRGKVIEDSVAYIRALAESSGRNAEWAEKAVRPPSANVTASEALALGVIEVVAATPDDLLAQLDGRAVTTPAGQVTIETGGIRLVRLEPTLLETVLGFFANPNVAAILLTLGTTGLIVELWNPGSIFPGAVGVLSLILAFYSFQVLPFAGIYVALIALGAVLVAVEAFTPTFGLVGASGLALLTAGLYLVFPGDLRVDVSVLAGIVLFAALFLGTALWAVIQSRKDRTMTGHEGLIGAVGRVDEWAGASGWVMAQGERWAARGPNLLPGSPVRVSAVDGLVLTVEPTQDTPGTPPPSIRS